MSRVLIVDDDAFIRTLIATTLAEMPDVELIEAGDGQEAIELAAQEAPALVFLDIDMPRMDGLECCERLRADPETSHAKIVMLTASRGPEAEAQAHEAGADIFLTKPFSPLELLRLVEGLRMSDAH